MVSWMSDHADYVTGQVRFWLEQRPEKVEGWLAEIERANMTGGHIKNDLYDEDVPANWAAENGGPAVSDEDAEELAGLIEDYALRELDPADGSIQSAFIRDCLSEADYADIAYDYLDGLVARLKGE